MLPLSEYPAVSPDATLVEAVVALEDAPQKFEHGGHKHRSVLVLDDRGDVAGKLTYVDMLKALEPRYEKVGEIETVSRFGWSPEFLTFMVKNFGLWEGSFQDRCAKAGRRKVADLIRRPDRTQYVDRKRPLNEAVHQLIMAHELSLLVTDDEGKVVGILRLIDVFDKVAEEIRACRD